MATIIASSIEAGRKSGGIEATIETAIRPMINANLCDTDICQAPFLRMEPAHSTAGRSHAIAACFVVPSYQTTADRNLVNTDLVVWYVFGHNHVPRLEDWPVMPVAALGFMLKPDGFFERNPALDLPPPVTA